MADTENHHSLALRQTAIIYYVQIVLLHQMQKERFCVAYANCRKLILMTWLLMRKNLLLSEALVWTNRPMLELTRNLDKSKVGTPFGQYSNLKMKRENRLKVFRHQIDPRMVDRSQYLKYLNKW